MTERYRLDAELLRTLEENGGQIAAQAKTALLKDPALKGLEEPLKFLSSNWRDPLTPGLVRLSCEAVGGSPEKTSSAALALCLMHQSFYIWDDIIDNSSSKMFKPTLFGKFGSSIALVIGGLSSAKAFSILNQMEIDKERLATITQLCWELWASLGQAEIAALEMQSKGTFSHMDKLLKIKREAIDVETCARIGAIIGDGSPDEIRHLAKYGQCLGIILELWKDVHVATNLTLGLAEKLRSGALPYATRWASQHSEKLRKRLGKLKASSSNCESLVTHVVEGTLATGVLEHVVGQMKKNADIARKELSSLNENRGTQLLKSLIDKQPKLVLESLGGTKRRGS
jgi:geranylgeranyl pyrophosphate synthase